MCSVRMQAAEGMICDMCGDDSETADICRKAHWCKRQEERTEEIYLNLYLMHTTQCIK